MKAEEKTYNVQSSYEEVKLPVGILRKANMKLGEPIEVKVVNGEIIIRKCQEETFAQMVNEVLDEHSEAFKGLVER